MEKGDCSGQTITFGDEKRNVTTRRTLLNEPRGGGKLDGMKPQSKSAHWARIVNRFDANLSTVRDYCKQHQVSEQSFHAWRKRLQNQPTNKLTFRLFETKPAALASVEVVLINGSTLRVACDERAIRVVLAAWS